MAAFRAPRKAILNDHLAGVPLIIWLYTIENSSISRVMYVESQLIASTKISASQVATTASRGAMVRGRPPPRTMLSISLYTIWGGMGVIAGDLELALYVGGTQGSLRLDGLGGWFWLVVVGSW